MPQHLPLSSTTGIRRTRLPTMDLQQSSRLASTGKMTQGVDMQSPTDIPKGFLPWAIVRQVISRSVITSIGLIVPAPYTTGISPQSCSIMSSAASETCGRATCWVLGHNIFHPQYAFLRVSRRGSNSNRLLGRYFHSISSEAFRTTSTEHGACLTTDSATLPNCHLLTPE